jgi:biopolymer transport protein ExbD
MKLTRTVNYNPAFFNVIPLVNVVFLVLLFFALGNTFVLQPGIALTLPDSPFTLAPQRNPQIVSITAAPMRAIYFHDQKVTLDEFSAGLANSGIKNRTLIVKADQSTPYDLVMQIADVALRNGFSVVFATNKREPK